MPEAAQGNWPGVAGRDTTPGPEAGRTPLSHPKRHDGGTPGPLIRPGRGGPTLRGRFQALAQRRGRRHFALRPRRAGLGAVGGPAGMAPAAGGRPQVTSPPPAGQGRAHSRVGVRGEGNAGVLRG